ncbi:hypothetical protein BD770DRAFT_318267 [Pilaira anomala]|nr:hypothetical protein BD770DRAFT_318267 [Pilaira anomala]
MDWGILQIDSQHFMLRDDLVFYRWTYYHINNCGNYRAIKEIPLPFAFRDKAPTADEEGGIQLPIGPNEVSSPTPSILSGPPKSPIQPSTGSFYGRRDFENRHDTEDIPSATESLRNLNRQPSLVGAVLEQIKSRVSENNIGFVNSTSFDTENDDDFDDDSD